MMRPPADSPDFAQLISRWLDETATSEEATRLWKAVREDPACAREYAAAARFEALLGTAVKVRNQEAAADLTLLSKAEKTIPARENPKPQIRSSWKTAHSARGIMIGAAAALVFLGIVSVLLWSDATAERDKLSQAKDTPIHSAVGNPQTVVNNLAPPVGTSEPVTRPVTPLTDHLDRFFLTRVELENVTLEDALTFLQKELRLLDTRSVLPLEKLKVTIPQSANLRRITFRSGPIPFLKAVRAVAALAGCEVTVDEPSITLIVQSAIFPQLAEKRTLSDLLAGSTSRDGKPLIDDPTRLSSLRSDARQLGVNMEEDGSAKITRGQWEALRQVTAARDLMSTFSVPNYDVYVVNKESQEKDRILTAADLTDFLDQARKDGIQIATTFTPQIIGEGNNLPVALVPSGDDLRIITQTGNDFQRSDSPQPTHQDLAQNNAPEVTQIPDNRGMRLSAANDRVPAGAILNLSSVQMESLGIASATTSAAAGATIVIVPTQTPPP